MESHPLRPSSSSSPKVEARDKQPEIQNPQHHQPPDHARATGGPDVRTTTSGEAVPPPGVARPSASRLPTSPASGPPPSPIDHHHHDAGTSAASRPPPIIDSPASTNTNTLPLPPPPPNSRWTGKAKWKDRLIIGPGHVPPPRPSGPVVRFSTPPPVPYCGKGRTPTFHPFPRNWTPPATSSSGKAARINAGVSQKPSSSSSGMKTSSRTSLSSSSGKRDIKAGSKNQVASSSSSRKKSSKGKNKKRWGRRLGTILEEEEEEEEEEDLEGGHGDEACSSSSGNEPPPATAQDDQPFLTKYCGCSIL